jgi:ankyrin repeat protein
MAASRSGKADVVALLLAKGADANARASRQQTALMWAAAERQPEVVKLLVEHGADVHARSSEWQEMMAVPPTACPVQQDHSAWTRHGAALRRAIRRSRVGKAPGGRRGERQ